MTSQSISTSWWQSPSFATKALEGAAKFWFSTVLVGQAIFSLYIVMFYYTASATGNFEQFDQIMPATGYMKDDFWGNIAVIGHVLFAGIITIGGLLQLLPIIRSKIPALHRWNGRLYILTAMIMSLSGVFLIISRFDKLTGGLIGHISLLINGTIIVVCAVMAFKFARQKKFTKHRIWALRLFLAVSGVWLFRVGLMAWLIIHGEPVGFEPATLTGPFVTVLYILVFILPLLLLEVYVRAKASGSAGQKLSTAMGVILLSFIIMGGIFAASMGLWLPRI